MKCNYKTSNFAVFDDLFDENMYKVFVQWFASLNFRYLNANQWMKVWRVSDGHILAAEEQKANNGLYNSPIDWLHQQITHLSSNYLVDIVGEQNKDYSEIVYTPYIYPSGTKISWHDDYGYSAACIFYCHEFWSPFWGGELMVADVDAQNLPSDLANGDDTFRRKTTQKILNDRGFGTYISPLPNRLAFTKGSVWHAINRVDSAAGENLRCSVVAFFKKIKQS